MTSTPGPAARAASPAGPDPAIGGSIQELLEDQRRALAREIHDDIGSALGAAHFDLSWVARHPGHAQTAAHVASAHEALRQAMAATQRVVRDLYPPEPSEDLATALRALTRDFGRRHGLPVAFEVAPGFGHGLTASSRLAAYRTVQEALANVGRHAPGSAVGVRAGMEGASAWLEVRDDGPGFDIGRPRPRRASVDPRGAGGFGLRGLAERAREAGAGLAIDSRPGHGTTVRLVLPVPSSGAVMEDGGGGATTAETGFDDENDDDDAQDVDGRSG